MDVMCKILTMRQIIHRIDNICRYTDHYNHVPINIFVQFCESINQYINTFIMIFISAGSYDDWCGIVELAGEHGFGNLENALSAFFSHGIAVVHIVSKFSDKSVRLDEIGGTSVKRLRFLRSDVAHSCEDITKLDGEFFQRIFCPDIQSVGYICSIIIRQIFIEFHTIACNASSYHCSMSCKDCPHLWDFVFEI